MAEEYENSVLFRIPYKVQYGHALYLQASALEHTAPVRCQVSELDENHYWEARIFFLPDADPNNEISYFFFIGEFDRLTWRLNICWKGTHTPMVQTFRRKCYLNSFCEVLACTDCPQKVRSYDVDSHVFLEFEGRFLSNSDESVARGRSIYILNAHNDVKDYSE